MSTEPRCADCGHFRFYHAPEPSEYYLATGGPVMDYWYGRCGHVDRSAYHTGRPCSCPAYRPDDFPLLTDMIGFEARRDIERLLDVVPVRRPRDPFEYQEGDVIDVTFPSGVTRPYRIVRVADIPPHFDLEPVG